MEALAASRWPEAEEVRVVRQLLFAFLAGDVDGYRHPLAVGVVDFQRALLAVLDTLLVHQADRRIAERKESVILLVHAVAVARKRVHEQLQLVVGSLADVNAQTGKTVLQMIRAFLQVAVRRHRNHQIEMRVHQLLALPGNDLLHPLDVLHGHLVARIRNARVPVLLLVEDRQLPFLIREIQNLIVNHRLRIRDAVNDGQQVDRHVAVVHLDLGVRTYQRRQGGTVHVHEAVHLAPPAAHRHGFVIDLEVRHRDDTVLEVHGEIAVHIFAGLRLGQEPRRDPRIMQLVMHLADLHEEVPPLLAVIGEQTTLLRLLRDRQIADAVRIGPASEISEIGGGQELTFLPVRTLKLLAHENVLLVQGISFSQGLHKRGEQLREPVVTVDIRAVFLYGILHLQNRRVFAGLGVQYTYTVRILHRKIDVLEDMLALASGTECVNRHGHADAQGTDKEKNV